MPKKSSRLTSRKYARAQRLERNRRKKSQNCEQENGVVQSHLELSGLVSSDLKPTIDNLISYGPSTSEHTRTIGESIEIEKKTTLLVQESENIEIETKAIPVVQESYLYDGLSIGKFVVPQVNSSLIEITSLHRQDVALPQLRVRPTSFLCHNVMQKTEKINELPEYTTTHNLIPSRAKLEQELPFSIRDVRTVAETAEPPVEFCNQSRLTRDPHGIVPVENGIERCNNTEEVSVDTDPFSLPSKNAQVNIERFPVETCDTSQLTEDLYKDTPIDIIKNELDDSDEVTTINKVEQVGETKNNVSLMQYLGGLRQNLNTLMSTVLQKDKVIKQLNEKILKLETKIQSMEAMKTD